MAIMSTNKKFQEIVNKKYCEGLTKAQIKLVAKVLNEYDAQIKSQSGFNATFVAKTVKNGATFETFKVDSDGLVYVNTKKEDSKMKVTKKVATKVKTKKEATMVTTRTEAINNWCEEKGYTKKDREAYGKAMKASREYLRKVAEESGEYWSKKEYHKIQDAMVEEMLENKKSAEKAFAIVTTKAEKKVATKTNVKKVEKNSDDRVTKLEKRVNSMDKKLDSILAKLG